jgi:hypothetical protein
VTPPPEPLREPARAAAEVRDEGAIRQRVGELAQPAQRGRIDVAPGDPRARV